VPYLDRMDLAYAAADLVMARSGAMTVAEIAAVGLPAVYVPLPHGNGEQRLNASGQVASGAAIIIDDADLDREAVATKVIPLVIDGIMRDGMTASAAQAATRRADDVIARMVLDAAAGSTHGRPG
jgi:UDP-N-acetylglucosamine--N-acetylmuramyl-(pentapeptide) pyrophosphoryl-undecaprenol N-acetylglucosamine transferase